MSISASELASIQADVLAIALDKVCVIQRDTTVAGTQDGLGSPTNVASNYTTIATTVCGMTEPTAGQLANFDYLIGSLKAWHVQLPVGTSVSHQDHLLIEGHTLEVQVVLQPRSYQMLLSTLASEIE